jgi:DNA primase
MGCLASDDGEVSMVKINFIGMSETRSLRECIEEIRVNYPLTAMAELYVPVRRNAQGGTACCPFHDDTSPSFSVFAMDTRFHCHGCGASGDVISFVQTAHNVSFSEAVTMLTDGTIPAPEPIVRDHSDDIDRIREARALFAQAVPADGTLVETYLRSRGIAISIPPVIRFTPLHYKGVGDMPCLVAALENEAGEITGVQRTFLLPDGTGKAKVAKPKLSLGKVSGSAIRLDPDFVIGEAVVCEGLEDGLSLEQLTGASVWVAAGASMMPSMQFPITVTGVIIASDNDVAGMIATKKAANAFLGRGLPVRLFRPFDGYKDFNDELRGIKS